ncbi:MAG: pilus assembly protein PilP, partial [Gammaproteobacteria bacterium]|nr:pilus assembly protein PilP [Gammaproteobacteria bacterium]
QYLEKFNITSLSMVGTLAKEDDIWALIKDAEGGVHMVRIGDYMGTNYGKVESIDDKRIDISEIVSDGHGGWLRRPRTIVLTEAGG